jgi:NADH-quinone oxidoreductase subunit E
MLLQESLMPNTQTMAETIQKVQFSEEAMQAINTIIGRYPAKHKKSALIPVLHIAQAESDGWLSAPVMDKVASLLEIQSIEVYEVASFYSMFNLKPVGKYLLEVCRTTPCMLRGSDELIAYFEKKLGIKDGQTTKDGMFTLKSVECLGSCGTAPMLQCGADYHENLDQAKADALLEKLRAENKRSRYC